MTAFIRKHYKGNLIACGSYTIEAARHGIENNAFDLIALGRPFIANPDLINKLMNNETLISYEPSMLSQLS